MKYGKVYEKLWKKLLHWDMSIEVFGIIDSGNFLECPSSKDKTKNFLFFSIVLCCSDVYALCVAYPVPFADRLYQETKQFLENHVQNFLATQVAPPGRIDEDSGANDVAGSLLHRYFIAWKEYSEGIGYLNFLYQ